MKDNQNEHNMGEQIMSALSDALQGGDFSNLNRLVSQSVNNVINEVGRQAQEQIYRQTQTREQMRRQEKMQREEHARRQAQQMYQHRAESAKKQDNSFQNMPQASSWQTAPAVPSQSNNTALLPFQFKKVGNVSNVLYQVFGGIGLGFTLLITFLHLSTVAIEGTASISGWIVNLLFLALFTGMIRLGIGQRRRLKLAERYAKLCGRNLYGEIEHLARSTGRKARHVIRDLQKMMKIGMFPEGHLDEKKTCFMLNDNIYRQYLETENNRRIRETETQRLSVSQNTQDADMPNTDAGQTSKLSEQESELNAMVSEGMECITKLRALNNQIPGEIISAKLSCLENLLKDLFDSVREHPEQMHRMHKLMDYYLPTTLKLVEAYEEFDRVSVPGADIIAAKAEIENTLDTINQAFTELLNNLFQDAVLDATTDAQVLKTMLAREGLMNEMENINGGN
ncbi:MAG: 5-bromo-4-chloroindolyl phosphate hydrolysis family protein [Lachnospiraceae bacterium]|nr:5-bromo-4-chloroindolyl phosphate hydrolysis family protein [Lachnospiraceae bacterium]